uniref:Si:dkey-182g1.6 n=1 Tax=Cyprinus carpio carpio TaxID=630221 RepID=A0A9J8CDR5_CYPCA
MRNHSLLLWVLLFVDGVFGAAEVSVSVMKGDSVTLHTDVSELQSDDIIEWMCEDNLIIAEVKNNKYEIKNNIPTNGVPDRSYEGRLELDHKTGSLTIKNITSQHEGTYILDIRGRHLISKNFTVTVHDGVKNISVKKGESVTLRTGVIDIQRYDWILWKFEDHLIAEINKETNQFILYDSSDKRFKDRLQPNEKTGSLTISDSETTDSGHYHLHMSSSTYTLQRIISVTVKGLSSIVIAVISVTVALVVAVALMIYCWCRSRQRSDRVV